MGFVISNGYFGGVFPEPPPNSKTTSNFSFSGINQLPLKVDFVVVCIGVEKEWAFLPY